MTDTEDTKVESKANRFTAKVTDLPTVKRNADDEVVSVSVRDEDETTQVVTGFFDKDGDGSVGEGEKIFTIKRDIVGDGQAQMQTQGYGAYAGYHSPMLSIATGMLLGSMMSRAFMPGYAPMYTQAYHTSPNRLNNLRQSRSEARRNSSARSRSKASGTGRGYDRAPRAPRGGSYRWTATSP